MKENSMTCGGAIGGTVDQVCPEHASCAISPVFPADQLIKDVEACQILGISRSQFHKLVALNALPRPIKIGRSARWRLCEIEKFIADRAAER